MLYLKNITNRMECDVKVDYYVPFTMNVGRRELYAPKTYWRTGNFKNSFMEISIDEKNGMLRDITLVSVNKAVLTDAVLENVEILESGTPMFLLDGDIKNGLCDERMDFYVYLSEKFIKVDFGEKSHSCTFIELERGLFGFDENNKLVSIIIKELSDDEYHELKDGLKL